MNKKGKVIISLLIVMIVIVLTSAGILFLVKSGRIELKDVQTEPVLNTEFLPTGRSGELAIRNFEFCDSVEDFVCGSSKEEFIPGENVYVRFVVESSTYNGDVSLVRNYRIRDPFGEIILEIDQKNDYNFAVRSNKGSESVVFADYFILEDDSELGEYALDIVVDNHLIDKKVTLSKKFKLVENE